MLIISSAAEQVASHLKEELMRGRWSGTMPGRGLLARELGVDGSTIERALGHLEEQGVIQSQGAGKSRLITLDAVEAPGKRILIVPYELEDQYGDYLMAELRYRLNAAGHSTSFASKSLLGLKQDPRKVASMLKNHPHDACILVAASKSVLEMASKAQQPCFALFGRINELAIAGTGPSKIPALRQAIDCLQRNGHRRIVMLSQSGTYQSGLSQTQLSFLAELKKRNLASSAYNLPEWDNTPEGLRRCLESLFQLTPPTAILIDDWMLQYAIQNFLGHQRGEDYRRVTCISTDYHPCYKWCDPGISHFYWDPSAVVRRIMRWVDHVAKGQNDLVQNVITAKFVEGAGLAL